MKFTSALTAVFAALVATTRASPINGPSEDVVISPPVTYPTASTTWTVGTSQVVTWDTSSIPAANTNETGMLLLGYEQDDSENLDIASPLATQFPIGAGEVSITVPNVTARTDYIVVLFGDSGNISPEFTILQL